MLCYSAMQAFCLFFKSLFTDTEAKKWMEKNKNLTSDYVFE